MSHLIHLQQDFPMSVEELFEFISEHEQWNGVFGLKVERLSDGNDSRNGVGSVRRLSTGGLMPFEESIVKSVPNEVIEYRITKGGVMKNHLGVQEFSSTANGGSHIDWKIRYDAAPGFAQFLKFAIRSGLGRGLKKLAKRGT